MYVPQTTLPDHLPGEPPTRGRSGAAMALILLEQALALALVAALSLPFWPFYLMLRLFYRRPPIFPSPARTLRTLRLILTERPDPAPSAGLRAVLTLVLLTRTLATGPLGLAWFLDELLYGRALREVQIIAPLFEISASRSGSTQLARYLEDDPHICAPSVGQELFPYLWLWKLSPLLSRVVSPKRLEERALASLPKEFLERHEAAIFHTDTFEIGFHYMMQLGDIMLALGPRVLAEELRYGASTPATRAMWEDDFLRFIDAIGRKTLLHAPTDPDGKQRRLMIKGHFLMVAPELERRYPDARFLTVLRAPDKRLHSVINFLRCQPTVLPTPALPWRWAVPHALDVEIEYCDNELAWLDQSSARKTVVRFDDYVRDLEGTMRRVYRACMDAELPPHVPRTHAPRVRTNYSVDRSLAQLGVDAAAFTARLAEYARRCRSEVP